MSLHRLGRRGAHLMHRGVGLAAEGYLRTRAALGHVYTGVKIAGAMALGVSHHMNQGQYDHMLQAMQAYTHHRGSLQRLDAGILQQISHAGDAYDHARAAARHMGI